MKKKPRQQTEPSIYVEYFTVLKQYREKYGDATVLFFQVGSFFEIYGVRGAVSPDPCFTIEKISTLCNLAIATKSHYWEKNEQMPILMAGFCDFLLDKYVEKTIQGGYTVVVYVQEDPPAAAGGKRRVLQGVYSPGTFLSTENATQRTNCIMCISIYTFPPTLRREATFVCGVSVVNTVSGVSYLYEYQTSATWPTQFDELDTCLVSYSPSEVVCYAPDDETRDYIQARLAPAVLFHGRAVEALERKNAEKQTYQEEIINGQWGADSFMHTHDFLQNPVATETLCLLLDFIRNHNPAALRELAFPVFYNRGHQLLLANHTLKQLNIIDDSTATTAGGASSVLVLLNQCMTAMGFRLFKDVLLHPITDAVLLATEYALIKTCLAGDVESLRNCLKPLCDFDKTLRQIVLRRCSLTAIAQLYRSLQKTQQIFVCLHEDNDVRMYIEGGAIVNLECTAAAAAAFVETRLYVDKIEAGGGGADCLRDPQLVACNEQIQNILGLLQGLVDTLNAAMRKRLDDTTAYVRLHKTEKTGYSLLITKTRGQSLKQLFKTQPILEWMGQTIDVTTIVFYAAGAADTETLDCPWLRQTNHTLSYLQDRAQQLFTQYYSDFLGEFERTQYTTVASISRAIARLDVLLCRAYNAVRLGLQCPEIDTGGGAAAVRATGVRHLLIEQLLKKETYTPNDLCLDGNPITGMLLYGINSSGKTSLLRSLGICIVLAQSGHFVPCTRFVFRPYRALFTRIVGTDNLFRGMSSFAVEMAELKVILRMADERSLILADEISRGSEIQSAQAITAATIMHLDAVGATYMITSHLHEIAEVAEIRELSRLRICHLQVAYDAQLDTLIYNRTLQPGAGASFYGLLVCQSLHLPAAFLDKAYKMRAQFATNEPLSVLSAPLSRYNKQKVRGNCELCGQPSDETHHLLPQKEADERGFIGGVHKNAAGNLAAVCRKCHDRIHGDAAATVVRKKTVAGDYVLTTAQN